MDDWVWHSIQINFAPVFIQNEKFRGEDFDKKFYVSLYIHLKNLLQRPYRKLNPKSFPEKKKKQGAVTYNLVREKKVIKIFIISLDQLKQNLKLSEPYSGIRSEYFASHGVRTI